MDKRSFLDCAKRTAPRLTAVACVVSSTFVNAQTFGPKICDQPHWGSAIKNWQRDIDEFGGKPVAFTAEWQEASFNPLTTKLDVTLTVVVDLGKPWEDIYTEAVNQVRSMQECEATAHLKHVQPKADWYQLDVDTRVDIDYYACAAGQVLWKIDDQRVEFRISLIPELVEDTARVRVASSKGGSGLPNAVRDTARVVGVLLGGFVGPLGAVIGVQAGDVNVMQKYNEAMGRLERMLADLNGVKHESRLELAKLISDYEPRFGRPFFTYQRASEQDVKDNKVSVLLHVPVKAIVPNSQMCEIKVALSDWFAQQSKSNNLTEDIPGLSYLQKPPPSKPVR